MSENPHLIPTRPQRWAFALIAAAAVAVVLLTCVRVWMPVYGLTRFIDIGRRFELRGTAVYRETPKYFAPFPGPDAGFDGQWYAEISLDPLLRDPQLKVALDNPPYRSNRILLPWLAWLGGLGRPAWVLNVYAALNPLFWLGYVGLLYVLFRRHGWAGVAGFAAMLFTCGIIESMFRALTDFPAFVLMGLAAMMGGTAGAGILSLSMLAREANLLGFGGVMELGRPWGRTWGQNLLRAFIVVGPFALWFLYVRWRMAVPLPAGGAAPAAAHGLYDKVSQIIASMAGGNFDWPLHAIYLKFRAVARELHATGLDWKFYKSTPLHALLTIIATLTQCFYLVTHPQWRNRFWRMAILFVPYFLCLSYQIWESHFTVTRHVLAINLAFNLLLAIRPTKRWALWFLLGNCFVPYGIYKFVDFGLETPQRIEFKVEAGEQLDGAVTAAYGAGWSGPEWNTRRAWRWSMNRRAVVILTNTRPQPVAATLSFNVRTLVPRDLRLSVRGVPVWAGRVEAKPATLALQTRRFSLPPGDTLVELATPQPVSPAGVPPNADVRPLAFMVSEFAIAVTAPPR